MWHEKKSLESQHTLTCMHMSELLKPPSTAKLDSFFPLSRSIASKMAFVWKQTASIVARAMCPFCVCCVIPTVEILLEHTGGGKGYLSLGMSCTLTDCSFCIIDPVRSKKTAEGGHKNTATIIRNGRGLFTNFS